MIKMMKIAVALTFILLMINTGLIVAGQQGVFDPNVGSSDLHDKSVDVQTLLTEKKEAAITQTSASPSYWLGIVLDWFGQGVVYIGMFVFGYAAVIYTTCPSELHWLAAIITGPLILIQTIGIFQFAVEVKKIIPFI